ncbi:uncharacterized protein [Coffea arabica]|uniref:Uncharacterized protein n=1 Tax=Coffea arabica TaxID=13443 RepID=A0A6P6W0F7_COFAR|nr:fibrous sheath CABYR-binding protein-like [Coffea arabica]
MATETVSSDHSTPALEQVEKEVKEEVEKIAEDGTSPPKGNEEKPKDETTPGETAVPLAETEKKMEEKQSEPLVVEEVVKAEVEEKPKAEEPPSLPITSAEPEEKIEDKHIEPPAIEEIKKPDDIPALDISSKDNPELAKEYVPKEETVNVAGVADNILKREPEGHSGIKNLETPQEEPPKGSEEEKLVEESKEIDIPASVVEAVEAQEEKVEEIPKDIDIPESVSGATKTIAEEVTELPEKIDIPQAATEAIETKEEEVKESPEKIDVLEAVKEGVETKVEQVEELPKKIDISEPVNGAIETKMEQVEEAAAADVVEVSAAEPGKEEISIPEPVAEDRPEEKPVATEQTGKEAATAEPEEKIEVETIKDREISTDEIDETKLAEGVESTATESSEQIASTPVAVQVETENVEVPPTEVAEKAEDKEKELTAKPQKQVTLEELLEKVEEETETKDLKTEEKEEKNGISEESSQLEAKEVDAVTSSIPPPEDSSKSVKQMSRDIELPAEIGTKIEETVASAETEKDAVVDKNVDVEKEPEKAEPETETKAEEAAEAVKETEKTDVAVEESKEVGDLKTTQEAPKEEVPGKTTQKSTNILSKVKHSLVKAKKAIIGKSPAKTPAAPPPETKEEVKS